MNKSILIGRLTKAPELTMTTSNIAVCKFTLAVDRKFKSEGQPTADFINCVAWRQTAEFVSKYFDKSNRIAVVGSIQTRSWEKDGQKQYATEIIVDEVEFVESKKKEDSQPAYIEAANKEAYMRMLEGNDDDCPF